MTGVEQQVADLACLSSGALRDRWQAVTASPVPRISPAMLRLALAWELQARAGGGLARDTTRALDQLAAAKTRTSPVSPGMRLVRAWAGKVHVVMIGDDGVIRWDDRDWGSLSEVVRAITGTRWSGPAFFGLKRKVAA